MSDQFTSEMAKAAGQVVVDTAKDARGVLGTVFGVAITEFGQMLGDQMKLWRFQNLAKILQKAQRIADEHHLSADNIKALPFGDAFRAIEAASYEESDEVQELWAQLLANAVDPSKETTVSKAYVDLLKSLSSADAALLKLLYTCEQSANFESYEDVANFNVRMNELAEQSWRRFPHEVQKVSIQNLARLRCIAFRPRPLYLNNLLGQLPDETRGFGIRGLGRWSVVDARKFQDFVRAIQDTIFNAAGLTEQKLQDKIYLGGLPGPPIEVLEMNYILTPLGMALMIACSREGENAAEGSG